MSGDRADEPPPLDPTSPRIVAGSPPAPVELLTLVVIGGGLLGFHVVRARQQRR